MKRERQANKQAIRSEGVKGLFIYHRDDGEKKKRVQRKRNVR